MMIIRPYAYVRRHENENCWLIKRKIIMETITLHAFIVYNNMF
jgi:hypothetical protein